MEPRFAKRIDPILLYAYRVLERIEHSELVDPEEVREQLKIHFRAADHGEGHGQDWELAKYALAAWIDWMLSEVQWSGREWWPSNSLQFEFFQTSDASVAFFERALEAQQLPRKDALEVFYICVVLGFRGLYAQTNAVEMAASYGLPKDVATWTRQTSDALRLGQGRPSIEGRGVPGDAPPLEGKFVLIGTLLGLVVLGALAFALTLRWLSQRGGGV